MKSSSARKTVRLPYIDLAIDHSLPVPDEDTCRVLWKRYNMLEHIGAHSHQVALLARALAERARDMGKRDVVELTFASGLLHDLGKSFTVRHGGSHAQIGASWAMTGAAHPVIAQAVLHHVWWPWPFPDDLAKPVFFVLYADKRVMHNEFADIDTRYADLKRRYGHSAESLKGLEAGHAHAQDIERALGAYLELSLHEYTFAGGRLVKRA
jgi:HD-like signal output (HDOD) protein